MEHTQRSLLLRVAEGDEASWQRFVDLYQPLIRAWLSRYPIQRQEVEDLTQDIFAAVIRGLNRFSHSGQPGAFRGWLRTITANRAREFWRAGKGRAHASGGTEFLQMVEQLEDPQSSLSREWDVQHDEHVLRQLLSLLDVEFEPATVRAFHRLVFDNQGAADVAAELNMSVAAVYTAKSRVLRRLREEAEALID
jgi:RNA polymerase sigma-70 factor (ECF subfamily)